MTEHPAFGDPAAGRYFIKMHGLRNHFVIVDGRTEPYRPAIDEIVRICDPQTGIGGDQLIILETPTDQGLAAGACAFMRILNVDGREAEACGNATRCVAWLLLEELDADELIVETLAGMIHCRRTGDLEVACTMGRVSMDWRDIPLSREQDTCHVELGAGPLVDGVALGIGNPHIVYFVDSVDDIELAALAPTIQQDELFPNGVNVGIAEIVDGTHLRSVVYERGAGLTTACGSGACVAAFAALARGLTDERELTVSMAAGDVRIAISDDGVATMTGPVAYCFAGYIRPAPGG
jgi:diaminopimelate epimerase